jgi:hypothetical protein
MRTGPPKVPVSLSEAEAEQLKSEVVPIVRTIRGLN